MVCKSFQVEENKEFLSELTMKKSGIKSFLSNENKVKPNVPNYAKRQKKAEEMSNKQPKDMNRERKF